MDAVAITKNDEAANSELFKGIRLVGCFEVDDDGDIENDGAARFRVISRYSKLLFIAVGKPIKVGCEIDDLSNVVMNLERMIDVGCFEGSTEEEVKAMKRWFEVAYENDLKVFLV